LASDKCSDVYSSTHYLAEYLVQISMELEKTTDSAQALQNVQAYASRSQKTVDVCVSLTSQDLPVPQGVILTGSVSPYQRSVLSQEIEKHLGIEGGKIQWNQP
jgi:hypothetical protein